ncbi:MAG: 3-hydroxyacyl-CoA dehydrogenase [Chloracidobacterium sp. CP2_5A]|nr:MAG: 3-hydroxyacyl-CoA dehydrogenase [Chloracidobacterium sp. CP2_5A]
MAFRYEKDADNIVTITMDMPNRSANVINAEFNAALADAFAKLKAEADLAGVIIASAKKTFLAGADLEPMLEVRDAGALFNEIQQVKRIFRGMETFGKPFVAAINGAAMGGGLELALACHYRVLIDRPDAQVGLPEVTLGLIPGGGGVTRMTRLLGLETALPLLTEGKRLSPAEAKALGVVNELAATPEELIAKAKAWIQANPQPRQPWDAKGYRLPGGDPRTPKVAQMLAVAPAILLKKTRGNFPAPLAILSAAAEGALVDFDTADRIESRYLAKVATGQVAKNMISAFWFQLNKINGGGSRPADVPPATFAKVGILGAGMMGSGIAYACATAGLSVVLKDVTLEQAEKGKAYTEKVLRPRVEQGRLTEERLAATLARIQPTATADDLQGCDLVIEAVFEDRAVKRDATREAEARLEPTAIFASNTSTLPITSLAQVSERPENFIGLHFFSPVDKMLLVEIIVGEKTSPETLARSFDFVRQIKKTPIVVNDRRGFYTSRVFATYTSEGMTLLAEGQAASLIEAAGMQAGMPVGPLAVSDEVSLKLMQHVRRQTEQDLAAEGKPIPDQPSNRVLDAMLAQGRAGKAAGAGFYEYPREGKKFLWPELSALFPAQAALPFDDIRDRLLFVQALETVRCLEENVVRSVADANIGSLFGWGFPAHTGGTLQFINGYGARAFVERAQTLAAKYGPRFAPPARLLAMAEAGESFPIL